MPIDDLAAARADHPLDDPAIHFGEEGVSCKRFE